MAGRTLITAEEVIKIVRALTRGRWIGSGQRYLGTWDTRLYIPTVKEIRSVSTQVYELFTALERHKHAEAFDCDDYAFAFTGMVRAFAAKALYARYSIAVGLGMGTFAWSGNDRHVCNWCLVRANSTDDMPTFAWLEPQVSPSTGAPWFHNVDAATDLEVMII